MLKSKKHLPTYNDGILFVFREKPLQTDFGAPTKATSINDLEPVAHLCYYECSKREQDLDFADRMSFDLDIKVKTQNLNCVDPECKVLIGNQIYDIGSIDRSKREMFLYLGGGRTIDLARN